MNRFKQARMDAGLSQKSAAISLGVKPPSMSDWENGKAMPTYDHLMDMASLYNVSIEYLLGHSEIKKEPAVKDGELKDEIIDQIRDLPDAALCRVSDFLSGLRAGREIGAASPAAPDPDPAPDP